MIRRVPLGLAVLAAAAFAAPSALAQGADQERMIQQRDEKLGKAFLKNGDWLTDYDAAKKRAAETGKLVFGYFTRSYAP